MPHSKVTQVLIFFASLHVLDCHLIIIPTEFIGFNILKPKYNPTQILLIVHLI